MTTIIKAGATLVENTLPLHLSKGVRQLGRTLAHLSGLLPISYASSPGFFPKHMLLTKICALHIIAKGLISFNLH